MQDNFNQFEKRKQDHIELALLPDNQASELNNLDQLTLQHEALPDLNFNEITLAGTRFGKSIPKPFLVSSMTAGHNGALAINRTLLAACANSGWAMGVGSQRRELTDKQAANEWHLLRQEFPDVTLFSNLGIAQLLEVSLSQVMQLTDVLNADGLIIHCNPLQEVMQPEGTPHFKGCWQQLENLVKKLPLPVIIKETGCGFSKSTLTRLNDIGVAAVDVSGLGGTHWGRIEGCRSKNTIQNKAAETFKNWGINTVNSVLNAVSIKPNFEIWGSGGVRHGLDAAKLFALGATTVGFAKPMLQAALISAEQVYDLMTTIEYELQVAMFCTGSRVLHELREKTCL
ncbi:isopentenyl-diphosphate delta-isomerase [Legionella beliardensis]|uniref:Isopentenyl-diphosphate delta-isomerase n=1 Tax=Legionella beliardensis TaxID=91822 RepID=A0A378I4X0_9GAMM|nr:type 2 isopentenyl-diphosphate Delta-isomerase [Legionella beliardensis]STX29800.1 isopentenyl-diphosphate delta-isomerase [Legionella beliardensis]